MNAMIHNLALCADCTLAAEIGEFAEGCDRPSIEAGLQKLGFYLVHAGETPDEFSHRACDCCGTRLAGTREFFVILG